MSEYINEWKNGHFYTRGYSIRQVEPGQQLVISLVVRLFLFLIFYIFLLLYLHYLQWDTYIAYINQDTYTEYSTYTTLHCSA